MTVIAFTQEMATLGSDVAAGVCEALGLAMVRHEVGDHVAGKMHVKKSLIRRLREGKAGPFERWTADERSISLFTAEEVYDLAVKGGVLVRGWGATMILRTVAHVPCIRVCAPMDLRVERCKTPEELRVALREAETILTSFLGAEYGRTFAQKIGRDLL